MSSGWQVGSGSGSVTSSAAPAISPCVERVDERLLVDDRAARGVDEDRRRLHARSAAASMRWRVCVGQRRVERDDVGLRERGLERVVAADARGRVIPKPSARRATACPMRPAPTIASVAPCSSRPSQPAGSHVRHAPSCDVARGLRAAGAPRRG